MPIFELTYPAGRTRARSPRRRWSTSLTTALLRAERAPDTEFFRDVTWGYVHELPAGAVNAAGRPVEKPTFKVDVTTPEGALSDRRRAEFVAEATGLVREAAGIPEDEALRVFVLMHEVAEGSWGAGGQRHPVRAAARGREGQREQSEAPVATGA